MYGFIRTLVTIQPEDEELPLIPGLLIGGIAKAKPQKQLLVLVRLRQFTSQRVVPLYRSLNQRLMLNRGTEASFDFASTNRAG